MFHSTLVKTEGSTQMLLYHNFLCHYTTDDQEISEPEKYTTHTIPELIGLYSTEIVCYSSLAFTTESKADRQTHFSLNWKFSWEVTVPPVSSTTKKLVQVANILGSKSSSNCMNGHCSTLSNLFYILKITKWMQLKRNSYHDTYEHLL